MLSVLPSPDELDRSCLGTLAPGQPSVPIGRSSPKDVSKPRVTWSTLSSARASNLTVAEVAVPPVAADPVRPCRESEVVPRPMNGPDRPSVTGSGAADRRGGWLVDPASSPGGAGGGSGGNQQPSLLPGMGSLFRPPLSADYAATRGLYPQHPLAGGYYPGHTRSAAAATSSSHLPPTMAPYSYYGMQFPPGYPPVLSRTFHQPPPTLEPYSAVLPALGSHPRSAFLQSQYAPLSPSTHITRTSQPTTFHLPPQKQQPVARRYSTSPLDEPQQSSPKEDRSRLLSISPTRATAMTTAVTMGASPSPPRSTEAMGRELPPTLSVSYRVPTGKEGSLKHRILTRPPDIRIEPFESSPPPPSAPATLAVPPADDDHPSPKRCKPAPASMPSTPLRPNAPVWRSPSPGSSTIAQTPQLHYPPHFMKGSIIQLASGEFKSVEQLRTEDFVQSAELSGDLRIDSSTVVRIEENLEVGTCNLSFSVGEQRVQVKVEAALEHPFFVFGQGWSSCLPEKTLQRYNLPCQKLQVGDVCISLTHRDPSRSSRSSGIRTSTMGNNRTRSPGSIPPILTAASLVGSEASSGPQTHNIETQTVTDSFAPSLQSGSSNSNLRTQCQTEQSQVIPPQRKRRWSAPEALNEGSANRKLS